MNNFIKVNNMLININSIDALYPNEGRGQVGYTMLISGQQIKLTDQEAQQIINIIDFDPDKRMDEFDPDKRIVSTVNNTNDHTSKFMKAATLIRGVITEHNNKYSPTNELTLEVDKDKRSIIIMNSRYSLIRIIDGLTVEDSISNSETFAEMKRKINDILIGYWMN